MSTLIENMQVFFIRYSVWSYMAIILFVSYALMQMSLNVSVGNFLGWVIGFALLCIPILVFVLLRDSNFIKKESTLRALWPCAFIFYPIGIYFSGIHPGNLGINGNLSILDIDGSASFGFVAAILLFLELVRLIPKKKITTTTPIGWMKGVSMFRLTALVVLLFSILAISMSNYFYEIVAEKGIIFRITFFSFSLAQMFLIYISYYLFYLIHHHILFRGILKERGLIDYFLGLILVLLILSPIQNFMISCFPVVDDLKLHTVGLQPQIMDDFNFSLPILALILSFPLIIIIEWYNQSNTISELEKQRTKTELAFLKSQINPHFFFNTLNNLYSMSLTNDKETPETILQLSELMRYVIYKGKEERVKLIQEIKYIKDYVDLQLIRVHKKVQFQFDVECEDENIEVPPLLFIVLVENAFKHGIEPAEGPTELNIRMIQKGDHISFTCQNSYEALDDSSIKGIGLENLKKRLNLLFPDNHSLRISDEYNEYSVTLKIELKYD